jgi:hypothetical protein
VSDRSRLATDYLPVGPNKVVTITNIPEEYSSLTVVECASYNSNKEYIALHTNFSSVVTGDIMTVTLPSNLAANTAYVRFTMKLGADPSQAISLVKMVRSTMTSN